MLDTDKNLPYKVGKQDPTHGLFLIQRGDELPTPVPAVDFSEMVSLPEGQRRYVEDKIGQEADVIAFRIGVQGMGVLRVNREKLSVTQMMQALARKGRDTEGFLLDYIPVRREDRYLSINLNPGNRERIDIEALGQEQGALPGDHRPTVQVSVFYQPPASRG